MTPRKPGADVQLSDDEFLTGGKRLRTFGRFAISHKRRCARILLQPIEIEDVIAVRVREKNC